ncbi:DUF2306 domain-containing protein [Pseudooctadecabacter sp.]|uniref:DUF2306 domain-containing protein n=1 Tax=Pseudooctadecabacter sp. TaxID=1966338 RepID=UPI0035C7FE9E
MKPIPQTIALLSLSSLPILAGVARLSEMGTGAPAMEATIASANMPTGLALHIIAASVFLILGAVQFLPATRRTLWHKRAGRLAIAAGLLGAMTGGILAATLSVGPTSGPLLVPQRIVFSLLWAVALLLGLASVLRANTKAHRAWMIRGYAIGAATGLQSLILLPWFFMFGVPSGLPSDLVMLASWLIALALAEIVIRRPAPLAKRPNPG